MKAATAFLSLLLVIISLLQTLRRPTASNIFSTGTALLELVGHLFENRPEAYDTTIVVQPNEPSWLSRRMLPGKHLEFNCAAPFIEIKTDKAVAKKELEQFLNTWLRAYVDNALDVSADLYANLVDYQYVEGRMATRNEVKADKASLIKRWPFRTYNIRNNSSDCDWESNGAHVTLRFVADYSYSNQQGSSVSGWTQVRMDVHLSNRAWVIVGFHETVHRR